MDAKEGRNETGEPSSVSVAVRVRPLVGSEKIESQQVCVTTIPENNQIRLGKDRDFTFDNVFGIDTPQPEIFEKCTKGLVLSCFEGYNATVLAYGQTGSGKTYTMGTSQRFNVLEEDLGIVPRVMGMIFSEIQQRKETAQFVVKVSFLEIYNEEIHDLLANNVTTEKPISIREDKGNIMLMGLHEEVVSSYDEMCECLDRGTLKRSTACTLMNSTSSRSHAIFTINIEQQIINPEDESQEEFMMAKFHFVDLAGSERAKRTGASGATLKEGININKGLLCLGNVISALTEESKKSNFVPYRDSKLTRILQDSLGGNAKTYMIACVSPAEINFEETLNTLKYASRARHIKNKPVINRDPQSALVAQLKQEVFSLKEEMRNYKRLLNVQGVEDIKENLEFLKKSDQESDEQLKELKLQNQQLERKVSQLTAELEVNKTHLNTAEIQTMQLSRDKALLKSRVEMYMKQCQEAGLETQQDSEDLSNAEEFANEIEKLKSELKQKETTIKEMQLEYENLLKASERDQELLTKKTEELEKLKRKKPSKVQNEPEIEVNVEDYGRMFAESVLAKIEQNETTSVEEQEIEETEETEEPEESEDEEARKNLQQEQLNRMESSIQEKEELMKTIQETFKEHQNKLMEEMNGQYYKKMLELEGELNKIVSERDQALEKMRESSSSDKQRVSERYRQKIAQLEEQLKHNRNKDKEQSSLYKMIENQKSKLSKLSDEIQRAKQQKVSLIRKFKEENEANKKWKIARQKEILQMKRQNLKKDQEIRKLNAENRKKELIARRKTEEIASIQRRQREVEMRKKRPSSLNKEVLSKWVADFTTACAREKELKEVTRAEIVEKNQLENQITALNRKYASFKLKIERAQMEVDNGLGTEQTKQTIEEDKVNLTEIEEQLETLEAKLSYKQQKLLEFSQEIAHSKIQDIKAMSNTIKTIDDSQNLIQALFDEVMKKASECKALTKEIQNKDYSIEEFKDSLEQAKKEREALVKQSELELNRIKKEFEDKEKYALEQLEEKNNSHVIIPVDYSEPSERKLEELEQRENEHLQHIQELQTNLASVTQKYNSLRGNWSETKTPEDPKPRNRSSTVNSLQAAREKAKNKKTQPEQNSKGPRRSTQALKFPKNLPSEEKPDVWERLQPKSSSRTRNYGNTEEASLFDVKQKWTCLQSIEAHSGAVCSMVSNENILYTGSNKSFKLWSLDNMSMISEVPAHSSFIRTMTFWPEHGLIITACSNLINIWDAISLQNIGSLRGHNEEVRALYMQNGLLFSAGKSSGNGSSIFVWDLKKSQTPIAEKEKNQDVFSINAYEDVLYYASRNHRVGRMQISDFEMLKAYEPPHFDTVTSLAIYKNSIVSGSRDKNLRRWELNADTPFPTVLSAHNDWVNSLATDCMGSAIYSAGKEGRIRVWRGKNTMKCVGDLAGHQSSVNCITTLNYSQPVIVSGGTDRLVKVWKLSEETGNSSSDSEQ